jgi:ribonuclease-3
VDKASPSLNPPGSRDAEPVAVARSAEPSAPERGAESATGGFDGAALEAVLGHRFADPGLLRLALTHASSTESRQESNERLEFLGDAVLGLVACERIFRRFPALMEGQMTKIKSTAVSRQTCAVLARSLNLDAHLVLGKGMQSPSGVPSSLAGAALEAVVGALYLDGGLDAAQRFLAPLLDPLIDSAASSGHQQNFKSVLQQHAQQTMRQTPCYRVLDEQGPDHSKCFKVVVEIGDRRFAPTWGQSKKRAEQLAALGALRELGLIEDLPTGEVRVIAPEPAEAGTDAGDEAPGADDAGK